MLPRRKGGSYPHHAVFVVFIVVNIVIIIIIIQSVVVACRFEEEEEFNTFCGQIRSETQKEISKIQNPKRYGPSTIVGLWVMLAFEGGADVFRANGAISRNRGFAFVVFVFFVFFFFFGVEKSGRRDFGECPIRHINDFLEDDDVFEKERERIKWKPISESKNASNFDDGARTFEAPHDFGG